MAQIYGSGLNVLFKKPEINQPKLIKYINKINIFWRLLLQTLSQILITSISRIFDIFSPTLGIFIEAGLSFGADLLFDYIFNGEVTKTDLGISAVINLLPFLNKGIRLVTGRTKNKFFGIASQMGDKTVKKQLKQIAEKSYYIGTDNRIVKKSKIFGESINNSKRAFFNTEDLIQKIKNNLSSNITLNQNKFQIQTLEKIINQSKKGIFVSRQLISATTSPKYLAKKTLDLVTRNQKNKINKYLSKQIKNKANKLKKIFGKKIKGFKNILNNIPDIIPLDSMWIDAIKFVPNNDKWDFSTLSCVIYFNKWATNNKKPIYLANKNANKILEFLTTKSPGGHYLDNFAWGWEIGKFLKNNTKFLFMSKIPVFGSFANTLFWSYKTISSLINSIKKTDYEWKNRNIGNEFKKGISDNLLKGWNLPYISPIIHLTRGAVTKNERYFITTGFKQFNKQVKILKIKNKYRKRRRY